MGLTGADVAALRRLAVDYEDGAERLEDAREAIGARVDDVRWQGPGADEFRGRWQGWDGPRMLAASGALRDAARQLRAEADEQEHASMATWGTGGAFPSGGGASVGGTATAAWGGSPTLAAKNDDDGRSPKPTLADPDAEGLAVYRTPGPQPFDGGLGPMRPGTSAPVPDAPQWTPPDAGADQAYGPDGQPIPFTGKSRWNTERPTWGERWGAMVWETKAGAAGLKGWGDAGAHMMHFLQGTGWDYPVDVDGLLEDVGELDDIVVETQYDLAEDAVRRAQELGATGPVTFPVNTPWSDFYVSPGMSENWFYATGGMYYNLAGTVTVYPPETAGAEWRYESETVVNFRDRYNWDAGKSTNVDGQVTTDTEMARFHQTGLAQEFNLVGASDTRRVEGSLP